MADDFNLKAPGSGLVTNPVRGRTSDHSSREETSGRRAQGRSWRRGLCECPIGVHRQLQRAADKHNINMTDNAVEALRRTLPARLSEDKLKSAEGQVEGES